VAVSPGDIILADDNGILVVPADRVAEVIDHCGPRVEYEAMIRRRILAGEKLGEITGASERVMQNLGHQASP
jgi:regulator of RNase E activity RraA